LLVDRFLEPTLYLIKHIAATNVQNGGCTSASACLAAAFPAFHARDEERKIFLDVAQASLS
jgi:hypothetical protein